MIITLKVINGSGLLTILEKISLDTAIFTPLWCLWFVVGMSILKGNFDIITSVYNIILILIC